MNLEYEPSEKTQIILLNISKILRDRKLIKNYTDFYDIVKKIGDNLEINLNYESNNIAIKIIYNNITTIKDSNDIENFLDKYSKYHKFFVISSVSKKAFKQFQEFPLTEVFQEIDLMINITEHVLQPSFRLLTKKEVEEYFKTFDNKKREMPRMLDSDPVARYFGAKIGDIFEINRPSITTGESISYRIVIQGNLNFLNY
jgi:DNA-directed RNA polymerase subunit H (RpoH/RPB5)|uniref:RNA polymerase subunit H/Rpb5 C-terminal domain-containing protein n=1 Tax=viral metagenome TaxID=1070528 RepID=A0A6C0H158_9ZZZZ